jgi:hypothetical protein
MDFLQLGLDSKLLGGQNGEGVLIEQIAFKFDTDVTTKEETVGIEIMGTAYTVMKDSWNPSAGYDELPEPFPVKDTIRLIVAEGKNDDNQILVNTLNRQFEIKPPLEDDDTLGDRFLKDGTNSVLDSIVGNKAFYRAKKSSTRTGEKLSDYFFNLVPIAKRYSPDDKKVVQDKIAKLRADKKAKQAEKDAAMAAFA